MASVGTLLKELKDYHDETGDARAGALVSLLYDVEQHNKSTDKKDDK